MCPPGNDGFLITREGLSKESTLADFRASAPPGTKILSEAELQASLDEALQACLSNEDVHVFGYGSLMWNPAFHFCESFPATVRGWSRKFCLSLKMARGSPERPGVMLALDRGGTCKGFVFRIPHQSARSELTLLWRREMLTGAYQARWVTAQTGTLTLRVLTFVANRQHRRYLTNLADEKVADLISNGAGTMGTCRAYFDTMAHTLEQLGIRDRSIERIKTTLLRHAQVGPETGS